METEKNPPPQNLEKICHSIVIMIFIFGDMNFHLGFFSAMILYIFLIFIDSYKNDFSQ